MLLSEMFGVERDTEFMVKGHSGTCRIRKNSLYGHESIYVKNNSGSWVEFYDAPTIMSMIAAGPDCIIHLPPPLTDEQRTVLTAMYTLGYRWLAEDSDGIVYSYGNSKPEKWRYHWVPACREMYRIHEQMPESIVKSIVSWSDPEPLDIGKALGVEG